MKNFILVIISILFPFSAIYAQGIAIDGSAGDTANKQAVMYATIALYNSQTGKLVNGTLTDEKGNYLITGVYPGK